MPGYPYRLRTTTAVPWRPRARRRLAGGRAIPSVNYVETDLPLTTTTTVTEIDQADYKQPDLPVTITATVTCTDTPGSAVTTAIFQEGFRWRNDDGSETGATWKAAQDTNTSLALDTQVRLRVLLDATGNPDPAAYTLYYKKTTDSTWEPVPVGAGAAPLTDSFTGTNGDPWNASIWQYQRGGTVSIQGNAGHLIAASSFRALGITSASVTDFELLVKGTWNTLGGSRFPEIGYRIGSNLASGNPDLGYALQLKADGGGTATLHRISSYATVGSASAAALNVNGVFWFRVRVVGSNHKIRWWVDGAGEPGTWQIDATDATYSTGRVMLANWNDSAVTWDDLSINAWPIAPGGPVYIAPSANITAGGQATTAQLTAPLDKTTVDFVVGRMWDDENGVDIIDLGGGGAAHYNETGRAVSITATVTATDTPGGAGGGPAWKWDFTAMSNQSQPSEFTTWGGSVPGEIVGGRYKSTVDWFLNQMYRNSTGTPAYPTTAAQIISVEYEWLSLTGDRRVRVYFHGSFPTATYTEFYISNTGNRVNGYHGGGDAGTYSVGLTTGATHRLDIIYDPGASPVLTVKVNNTTIYSGVAYAQSGLIPGLGVDTNNAVAIRKWYYGNLADGMPD